MLIINYQEWVTYVVFKIIKLPRWITWGLRFQNVQSSRKRSACSNIVIIIIIAYLMTLSVSNPRRGSCSRSFLIITSLHPNYTSRIRGNICPIKSESCRLAWEADKNWRTVFILRSSIFGGGRGYHETDSLIFILVTPEWGTKVNNLSPLFSTTKIMEYPKTYLRVIIRRLLRNILIQTVRRKIENIFPTVIIASIFLNMKV